MSALAGLPARAAEAPVARPSVATHDDEGDDSPHAVKLSLARELQAIGDVEGARSLVEEVEAESAGDLKLALGIRYNGQAYEGWQSQRSGRTVQDKLEAALSKFAAQPIGTLCAGRTDAGVHALMQQFRFVPDARLDDLMISYATDGGGVGPHFDSYDVFLLQAHGQRKWRIGRSKDLSLQPGVPLKI
eukprot:gene14941-19770_t